MEKQVKVALLPPAPPQRLGATHSSSKLSQTLQIAVFDIMVAVLESSERIHCVHMEGLVRARVRFENVWKRNEADTDHVSC
jgi:hypothetical protein